MIQWGIAGCGFIANQMAQALLSLDDGLLLAVASRDVKRAEEFAKIYQVPRFYGSYEALARDDEVDAVYVAAINSRHYDVVRIFLEAGKAVLCEKPMTVTAAQAQELFALAREKQVLLMEGLWTRFLPAWQEVRRIVKSGEIGELREFTADFSKSLDLEPRHRIVNKEKGGGTLLDLGVYCISMAFFLLGSRYITQHTIGRLTQTGIDGYSATMLQYPDGATALITCGCDMAGSEAATVQGSKGWLEIPHFSRADEMIMHNNGETQTLHFPLGIGFVYEIKEFQDLLEAGETASAIMPPEDTVAVLRLIEKASELVQKGYEH